MPKLQKLVLSADFAQAVCFGQHRSVIVIGREYARLHEGDAAMIMMAKDQKKIVPAKILNMNKKAFAELDDQDAKAQGTNLTRLKAALRKKNDHLTIRDSTPVYIVNLEVPVAADLAAIRALAQAYLSDTSDYKALKTAQISLLPDYRLVRKDSALEGGGAGQLRIVRLKESACDMLAAFFERAVGKTGVAVTPLDKNDNCQLFVQGDMANIRQLLEAAFPDLAKASPSA